MYKVDIPLDTKESAAIERRQNREAARKSRIFDSKNRTIGVDIIALDQQVKESNERRNDEKLRNNAYASMMIRNDQTTQLLDARNKRSQDLISDHVQDFRFREQMYNSRREFDLNDPDALKNAVPLGQNDHGISSLQSFVGEDGEYSNRREYQKEQIREWSLQLQKERQNAEDDRALQDRMYDLKRIQLDNKACELEEQDRRQASEEIDALKDFNQRLADEQSLERKARRNEELAENITEIRNQVMGDMLTENPNVSRSAFGPHRVIPDRWKGMSEQELAGIRGIQERQRLENIKKKDSEKEHRDQWSLQKNSQAKAGILLDREQQRQTKSMRQQLDAENAHLCAEQNQKKKELDQKVYTNIPTEDYYLQFNTTTR